MSNVIRIPVKLRVCYTSECRFAEICNMELYADDENDITHYGLLDDVKKMVSVFLKTRNLKKLGDVEWLTVWVDFNGKTYVYESEVNYESSCGFLGMKFDLHMKPKRVIDNTVKKTTTTKKRN